MTYIYVGLSKIYPTIYQKVESSLLIKIERGALYKLRQSEHIEMYLKVISYSHEKGQDAKVSSIAKLLDVTQPSVVQMLHKPNNSNLVEYSQTKVTLTEDGRKIGRQMIRNTRLLEVR